MAVESKKILPLLVLDVLRVNTDAEHRLTQRQISDVLEREHGVTPDRKTLKAALISLIDAGYDLRYTGAERVGPGGEPEVLATDWFLSPEFSDTELRLIIDSLLFSQHISARQRSAVIDKLAGLTSKHFHSRLTRVKALAAAPKNPNENLLGTVELINEAIVKKRQVRFQYAYLGVDKKPHLKVYEDSGEPWTYTVNPYELVAADSHYYLICNLDRKEDLGH
ncbi:MAG: WYL domain-containing protein, partial [Propionibacteriaceae bacterium]|nr:WYL domain-containing protein [Propionibacteriaceae bacterium]